MAKGKGSSFEREMCKTLGLWWTGSGRKDARDDVFWRSANSGARAKVRSRVGKNTFGQYGDIQATDPIGQPLLDLCTIELKRGYSRATVGDMLDTKDSRKQQQWEAFVEQAVTDHKNAGTPYWLLITRRDRREAVVFMPWGFYVSLLKAGSELAGARPYFKFVCKTKNPELATAVLAVTLPEFLRLVEPFHMKRVLKNRKTK